MLRRLPPCSFCNGTRSFSFSAACRQLQREDKLLKTHGAGLINYQVNNGMFNENYLKSRLPTADLMRTKVSEGLGTSEADPYVRTLPNRESVPPESSVLRSAQMTAPSLRELGELYQKWGSMQYWLSEPFPRLVSLIDRTRLLEARPVTKEGLALLAEFENKVIGSMESVTSEEKIKIKAFWEECVARFGSLSTQGSLDKEKFKKQLEDLYSEVMTKMEALHASMDETSMALEMLCRKTVSERNQFLQDEILKPVLASVGTDQHIWSKIFYHLEERKNSLFLGEDKETLLFALEAIFSRDSVQIPHITGAVALLFALIATTLSPPPEKWRGGQLGKLNLSPEEKLVESIIKNADMSEKRREVSKLLQSILSDSKRCSVFARTLEASGKTYLCREVLLIETLLGSAYVSNSDLASSIERFHNVTEVKTLLSSLLSGTNTEVSSHVRSIFPSITEISTVDAALRDADWDANWKSLSYLLLRHPVVLTAVRNLIKNAIGAKGVAKFLYSETTAEELSKALHLHAEREASKATKIQEAIFTLSSYEKIDETIRVLYLAGEDLHKITKIEANAQSSVETAFTPVSRDVLIQCAKWVHERHPNWQAAGVLPPQFFDSTTTNSLDLFELVARIIVRLLYVPQAGAAAIANRTRNRIGAIGQEPHQFNVPVEIGQVEHYNNLQYKRYDWQGWYQRMVDIHNRNISIRCRLDDLKFLDGKGNAFATMQVERRLRILAQDRVGMGILKLDSDKYEDRADNLTHGALKLSELLADSRKALLGEEYWPSVEVKVRRPSGQSKAHYSLIDYDRIEKESKEYYEKYRDAKKKSIFVTPMDLWLETGGMQTRRTSEKADADGYTVDSLQSSLNEDANN